MTILGKDPVIFVARSLAFVCLLALNAWPVAGQDKTEFDVRPFPVGKTVERQLVEGELHLYEQVLEQGGSLRLDLEEKGVDCVVAILPLGGDVSTGFVVNFGSGFDRETFTYIAHSAGKHTVAVKGNRRASYSLTGSIKKVAGAAERQRAEASSVSAEGFKLWFEPEKPGIQKASEYGERSLTISRDIGDVAGVVLTLTNLSVLRSAVGDERRMLEAMGEASAILLEKGDSISPHLRAAMLIRLGTFLRLA